MLLKKQRNDFHSILSKNGLVPTELEETRGEEYYQLSLSTDDDEYYFMLEPKSNMFEISMRPGKSGAASSGFYVGSWNDVLHYVEIWASSLQEELAAPDLWAEAAKTAQLFAGTTDAPDDKFTRTELAEVQGQLRQLQQSFAAAALPEAARQKLIELTQTAAVKAESLTKKDWQNWIIGGFISSITALALNPTQAGEVLKLVKAAFGGLFLH
ncbi:hypothetical protein [Hymenobacter psychrotolerans]|uniref:Uncharacterized protein n=1 Tax=Hymenobacter psychrotolerans DSM 18569 TaxID=1121959 RepID=A0A1M6T4Q8_9BACT|nr:hypothetical protein [Hymenobacter psychrotolerans]SHK51904.1 hypothetical protein SAMN02746009_01077 [Hymenobacter psychrotolerans DSM 18569]